MDMLVLKVYAAVACSLFMVVVLYIVSKRRRYISVVKPNKIYLMETLNVGPKERICLLKVNNQKILIGSTPGHISLLTLVHEETVIEERQQDKELCGGF